MVSRIVFGLFLLSTSSAELSWRRYAENAKDVEASGSEFVPQFQPFQFNQPIFGSQVLAPQQQSHLLGFQHRFQPGFGPNQFNQPHVNHQQNVFQGQQSQVQQVLIPPQQDRILSPPPPNQNIPRPNPQSLIFQQNPIDAFRNQPLQNQPNRIQNARFPQQNFGGQDQNFANQHTNFQRVPLQQQTFPQPQQQALLNQQQNGFNTQFQQRPVINNQPQATNPPRIPQQTLQQQLINQQQLLVNHQQAILNQQSQQKNQQQNQQQSQLQSQQQNQHQNFQQNFQQFNNGQNFQQQPNFIPFNQQNQNINTPPPTVFTQAPFPKEEPVFRPNAIQNPVSRPTFEFQSSVTNQDPPRVVTQSPLAPLAPQAPQAQNPNILLQKSQEQQQYNLGGNFLATTKANEVTQTQRPTTHNSITSTSVKPVRTPKPIVHEIKINLDESGIPVTDTPQLFIKDDRQKQFQQIRQQQLPKQVVQQQQPQQSTRREKTQKPPSKDEKTQEELINEQIQKLLQRHNLEIIDKEKESTESQEAQLSQFSRVLKGKYNYNVQLVGGSSILKDSNIKKPTAPPQVRFTTLPPLPELPEHIKKDYDIKLVNKDDFFKQFDIVNGAVTPKVGNNSLFLADGQEVELLSLGPDGKMKKISIGKKPTKKSVAPTTTVKPPKVLFEELAKGVIPPGADYELIRQKENGEIEKVSDVSNAKKVTFVLLEEQPDGSVKVQGVKGNGNQESSDKDSVNAIIKRIKEGTLKLPPSQKPQTGSIFINEIQPRFKPQTVKSFVTVPTTTTPYRSTRFHVQTSAPLRLPTTPETSASTEAFYDIYADINSITTESPAILTSQRRIKQKPRVSFLPTLPSSESTSAPIFPLQRIKPTSSSTYLLRSTPTPKVKSPKRVLNKLSAKYEDQTLLRTEATTFRTPEYGNTEVYTTPLDVIAEESNIDNNRPLVEILKDHGLNQMAKFLDQSGLDTILNETGPYTIFIPTDKAFKALEAQLGGTDRAEDKFRENPRLLSGLLLHHVVPGSFRVEDLQDEMTGVSLAGTQLRVNTYDDKKANSQRIVTINGAKVSTDDRDINVPQGLAHAVDRVLFPLPVGDILQTLRGDRERRFTKFIKSLEASGLADMLTTSKTYTVFAPTDNAFSALTDSELDKLLTRREAARTIVLRHVVPGTLYGAGMQYYQLKETMEKGQKIAIYKDSGKIKANSAEVISSNIPATNGVVHVVETLL